MRIRCLRTPALSRCFILYTHDSSRQTLSTRHELISIRVMTQVLISHVRPRQTPQTAPRTSATQTAAPQHVRPRAAHPTRRRWWHPRPWFQPWFWLSTLLLLLHTHARTACTHSPLHALVFTDHMETWTRVWHIVKGKQERPCIQSGEAHHRVACARRDRRVCSVGTAMRALVKTCRVERNPCAIHAPRGATHGARGQLDAGEYARVRWAVRGCDAHNQWRRSRGHP